MSSVIDLPPCPVCAARQGELLRPPHQSRSVTSGGSILNLPLQKIQCLKCGVLRQRPHSEESKIELYRHQYALYHQRPGTSESELHRYIDIADWILAELGPFTPRSIFDVGCGGGFLLDALRRKLPTAQFAGIDPSIQNSAMARARGFSVVTGFISGTNPPHEQYDLVLTSHVLSHIADPLSFLAALAKMIVENGRVLIFSHDGREPGADHLFADVEFSFCREHIGALGAKAGLELLEGPRVACPQGQLDKQVLVFRRNSVPRWVSPLSSARQERLLQGRRRYFAAWETLADQLATRIDNVRAPVFNFGASFWSLLLAAYCPEYWKQVDACVVDDDTGTFLGKPVLSTGSIASEPQPLIVLGINPANQTALAQRLAAQGEVVVWNDLITQ